MSTYLEISEEDIATFLKGESLYYIKGKELTRTKRLLKEREEQKGWRFGTIKS